MSGHFQDSGKEKLCGKRMKVTQRHAVEENHRLIAIECSVMYKQIKRFKANLDSREIVCLLYPNWEQVSQKRGLKTKGLPLILLLNSLGTTRRPAV